MAGCITALLTMLGGCGSDDGTGSAGPGGAEAGSPGDSEGYPPPRTETTPLTPTSPLTRTSPLGKYVTCPDGNFPTNVAVPRNLLGSLEACTNTDGGLLLKNNSPVMLQVQPSIRHRTSVSTPTPASDDLRSIVNAQLAARTSRPLAVVIPPGGYTTAYADGQPAVVTVEISVVDAAQAYTADVLVRYLENRLSTRGQRLGRSAATCAEEASTLWTSTAQNGSTDLDQLLAETALGPAMSCQKLFRDVSEELNEEPPKNESVLRREFKGLQKEVRASVWDDLVSFARRAAQVSPRG